MSKKILFIFHLLSVHFLYAQNDTISVMMLPNAGMGTAIAPDYLCVGFNPANLGRFNENKKWHLSVGPAGTNFGIYAPGMPVLPLITNSFSDAPMSDDLKHDATKSFVENETSILLDFSTIGASFQLSKYGGIGITYTDKVITKFKFSEQFAKLIIEGPDPSVYKTVVVGDWGSYAVIDPNKFSLTQIFYGSHIDVQSLKQINISYGKKCFDNKNITVYGGVGIRYLESAFALQFDGTNKGIEGFISFEPTVKVNLNPFDKISLLTLEKTANTGTGWAGDIGGNIYLKKQKINIGLSFNNIGYVTYKGYSFTYAGGVADTLKRYHNVEGMNIIESVKQLLTQSNILVLNKETEKVIYQPSNMLLSAYWKYSKKFGFSVDINQPFNNRAGNLSTTGIGFGANYSPHKIITIGGGFSVSGSRGFAVPIGFTLGFLKNQKLQINMSISDIIKTVDRNQATFGMNVFAIRFTY